MRRRSSPSTSRRACGIGSAPLVATPARAPTLLLIHHSLGYPIFDDVIGRPDDVVAMYHNVTPERYFSDPVFQDAIRLGREQLSLLALRATVGVADSNFNRREMLAVGFRRVEVLARPHRLLGVRTYLPRNPGIDQPIGCMSGEWWATSASTNSCARSPSTSTNFEDDDARLVLIGDTVHADYVAVVKEEARRLGVSDRVVMLGKVSDRQLRSAFLGAGVFVSLSEHEGFGVPILEAMAARVPVVGYAAAAVPETMGGAGILLRTKDPEVVAATVQALRTDPDLQDKLVARQDVRVRDVQAFNVEGLLARVIGRASGAAQPLEVQVQGPFETSYSLAIMNRSLACALDGTPDRSVSIYATEGPGDYQPSDRDLVRHPQATMLFRRSRDVPYPHVVIRQMWPPRLIDTPGGLTCEYFGWEESRIPQPMVDDFNRYLEGIGVMSHFVKEVLEGLGCRRADRGRVERCGSPRSRCSGGSSRARRTRGPTGSSTSVRPFRARASTYCSMRTSPLSTGSDDVSLILKTFPNPHNTVADLLASARARHPNPPDVRWIDRDMDTARSRGSTTSPTVTSTLPGAKASDSRLPRRWRPGCRSSASRTRVSPISSPTKPRAPSPSA